MAVIEIDSPERLAHLVQRAPSGEEIVLSAGGIPKAKLVPIAPPAPAGERQLGGLVGKFFLPDDFDDPLPEDILRVLEGRD